MPDMILKRPFCITCHQDLPLCAEPEAFLEHPLNRGTSQGTQCNICRQMLNVMEHLELKRMRVVSLKEIRRAAERWSTEQRSNLRARSYSGSALYFADAAKKWLRFAGKLDEPKASRNALCRSRGRVCTIAD